MKKVLLLAVLSLCTIILIPVTKSFAFGTDIGEHCWTGDSSGVTIKLQVTQFGAFYNLNGAITLGENTNPAYGTGFYDVQSNIIKLGYTIARTSSNDFLTILIELNPATLNGTKVVVFHDGSTSTESVTYTPCP